MCRFLISQCQLCNRIMISVFLCYTRICTGNIKCTGNLRIISKERYGDYNEKNQNDSGCTHFLRRGVVAAGWQNSICGKWTECRSEKKLCIFECGSFVDGGRGNQRISVSICDRRYKDDHSVWDVLRRKVQYTYVIRL